MQDGSGRMMEASISGPFDQVGAQPPHARAASAGAIAPVGLELPDAANSAGELPLVQQTGSIRLPIPRRRLGGIVIGAVAACGLILVAAAIARVSHASGAPTAAVAQAPVAVPPSRLEEPSPSTTAQSASATPKVAEAPTTGTLHLERPAVLGRVLLDGKKLTSTSALVACGAHQLKLGPRAKARTVQVPCGGELVVSK